MEANAYGMPGSGWIPAARSASEAGEPCAVTLIDRRTGATHRINGRPLTLLTRNPKDAVTELLAGRDTRVWEARIEVLAPKGRRA